MKKIYTDTYTDKMAFVKDIITPIVRQMAFTEARYVGNDKYEVVELIMASDKYGVKIIKQIDVTADSCIGILTDVLLNI